MNVETEMYIWIDAIFKEGKIGIVVDGYSFDEEFGLEEDKRHYKGDFSVISRTNAPQLCYNLWKIWKSKKD